MHIAKQVMYDVLSTAFCLMTLCQSDFAAGLLRITKSQIISLDSVNVTWLLVPSALALKGRVDINWV